MKRIKKRPNSSYKPEVKLRDPVTIPFLFSDADLLVNQKNFKKYKKLFVIGQSGAGKTTASRMLAKRFHAKIVHLDNFYHPYDFDDSNYIVKFIKQSKDYGDKFLIPYVFNDYMKSNDHRIQYMERLFDYLIHLKEPLIIEGIQTIIYMIYENSLDMLKYTFYLKSTSFMKGLYRRVTRNREFQSYDIRWEKEMVSDYDVIRRSILEYSDDIIEIDESSLKPMASNNNIRNMVSNIMAKI